MKAAIVAGLLGILATLSGVGLTEYFRYQEVNKVVPTPTLEREGLLVGIWVGEVTQKKGKEQYVASHPTTLTFDQESDVFEGNVNFTAADKSFFATANLMNLIFDGDRFKVDFVNKDSKTSHFGSLYGTVSSDGKKIQGEFIAYGLKSEMFIGGLISFTRQL